MLANLRVSSVLFKQNKGSIDVGTQQNKKNFNFCKAKSQNQFRVMGKLKVVSCKKNKSFNGLFNLTRLVRFIRICCCGKLFIQQNGSQMSRTQVRLGSRATFLW